MIGDVYVKQNDTPPEVEQRADRPRASASKISRCEPSGFGFIARSVRSVRFTAMRRSRAQVHLRCARCALGAKKLHLSENP